MAQSSTKSNLRIASLLPAATDICMTLGLKDLLVAVTHECDHPLLRESSAIVLTRNGLADNLDQGEIHQAVQDQAGNTYNSLYPILQDRWKRANPNLILTQDLCLVCGPSPKDVCELNSNVTTISRSPETLDDVAETFVTVAKACHVEERGCELREHFLSNISQVHSIVKTCKDNLTQPKVFLVEWLDPPFDGGHWIPEMISLAGSQQAIPKTDTKSKPISWDAIHASRPDVVIVACCGFELERNVQDAQKYWKPHLAKLVADHQTRIYAANGNQFFARPGPSLCRGVSIIAQCAYGDQPAVLEALEKLSFSPKRVESWEQVTTVDDKDCIVPDVEDLGPSFVALHEQACKKGETTYRDPASGYQVFTELAHKKRGKCCGSGCRHCPFHHENVKDKAAKIKQPAFLYQSPADDNDPILPIKVLFFSGGKDSFLTLRALLRRSEPAAVVLLTTFDATSRLVAHQEVSIQDIQRQAKHLQISLLGIPLHRGSREAYQDKIAGGIQVIEDVCKRPISTLVFGDLHLEHIRSWRESQIGKLGYDRDYPLWQVSYDDLLLDLEASQVPCVVSASTVEGVSEGTLFTRDFFNKLQQDGEIDGFGERGEFHSLAQVWKVDRKVALGL